MTSTATIHAGQYRRPTLSKDGRTMTVHIPYGQKIKSVRKSGNCPHPSVASPRVVR